MTRAMVVAVMPPGRVLSVEFPTPTPTLWPWPTEVNNEASDGFRSDAVKLMDERRIVGVREFLESWMHCADKMHPQVLALLSGP